MVENWREIESGPKLYIMTWFGTLLTSRDFDDWIEHRPLLSDEARHRLLYVEDKRQAGTWTSGLWKQYTRPRRLPSFTVGPVEPSHHSFRCSSTDSSDVIVNSLMCAMPTGAVEINRQQVSHWETFLLLDEEDRDLLSRLVSKDTTIRINTSDIPLQVEPGFMLRGAHHSFALEAILKQIKASESNGKGHNQVTDVEGVDVDLALQPSI